MVKLAYHQWSINLDKAVHSLAYIPIQLILHIPVPETTAELRLHPFRPQYMPLSMEIPNPTYNTGLNTWYIYFCLQICHLDHQTPNTIIIYYTKLMKHKRLIYRCIMKDWHNLLVKQNGVVCTKVNFSVWLNAFLQQLQYKSVCIELKSKQIHKIPQELL